MLLIIQETQVNLNFLLEKLVDSLEELFCRLVRANHDELDVRVALEQKILGQKSNAHDALERAQGLGRGSCGRFSFNYGSIGFSLLFQRKSDDKKTTHGSVAESVAVAVGGGIILEKMKLTDF